MRPELLLPLPAVLSVSRQPAPLAPPPPAPAPLSDRPKRVPSCRDLCASRARVVSVSAIDSRCWRTAVRAVDGRTTVMLEARHCSLCCECVAVAAAPRRAIHTCSGLRRHHSVTARRVARGSAQLAPRRTRTSTLHAHAHAPLSSLCALSRAHSCRAQPTLTSFAAALFSPASRCRWLHTPAAAPITRDSILCRAPP